MKRYLAYYNENHCENRNYDVVIVGAGIGGLYTSLMLPKNLKIAVLSKKDIYDSDSCMAQGGIAASIQDDNRKLHVEDTINAGCYVNNLEAVNTLVDESEEAIESLIKLGVNFDRDLKGNFYRSFEGNHSIPRILHVNGDSTGKGIMDALIKEVKNAPNIEVIPNVFALDIIEEDNKCNGIVAYYKDKFVYFKSRQCVMASGGIGQLFSKTTNADILTGDGIAMAIRANVELDNMEYIQFHPTAFYSQDFDNKLFLISEAVRGEGAMLRNSSGKRFMKKYDNRMELAPRDIVARAISHEIDKSNSNCVYLDATMYNRDFLKNRFNKIYSECKNNGFQMEKDYIPVIPAEHYFMGGIKVDLYSRTNMTNLYAVGECACTGVHGANRLASNSLIEAIVFGKRAAGDISKRINYDFEDNISTINTRNNPPNKGRQEFDVDFLKLRIDLKKLMDSSVGIIRNIDKLQNALNFVDEVLFKIENLKFNSVLDAEVYNMYLVARSIIESILNTKDSIGSNYVEEYSRHSVV